MMVATTNAMTAHCGSAASRTVATDERAGRPHWLATVTSQARALRAQQQGDAGVVALREQLLQTKEDHAAALREV